MAILVLAAIFPLVVLVTSALGLVASGNTAIGLPVRFGATYLTRTLLTAITLVILMTWVAMPALSRLARRWLYPGTDPIE
jgi:antibiotic biosynthesis monooxygenase (ABM) superfamily enzyme